MSEVLAEKRAHFIRQLIQDELNSGKHKQVITRFPPEPNGYLHVGHAKSICLNFGMAEEFSGKCFLRFDDTNPTKEEDEYVQGIIEDVRWLGFDWCEMTHASDYYQALFDYAMYLIEHGKAYVDSLSADEMRAYRGTLTEPGKESPYRNRSVAENKALFLDMKAGKYPDGAHVLRAKIDMNSPNLNMRDPALYRIRHAHHQRTGDAWCIYPMYDYAHPVSDALEHITHSLCTLEFQDHRPLYDWFIENLPVPAKPVQTEFARLNLSHTITSKRKLRELVEQKVVDGWDDPRMPTIRGMRKRGYPPQALRTFCEQIGISRSDSIIDMSILESAVRETLNATAPRAMSVIDPLKVVIETLPAEYEHTAEVSTNQNNDSAPKRRLTFRREIYIERSDFMQEPPKGYFRLAPGAEVRLRHSYIIKCERVEYDAQGNPAVLYCSHDANTLGKNPEGRKVKGVIHWVSCQDAVPVKVLEYDRLFLDANPGREEDFLQFINPESCREMQALVEPWLATLAEETVVQFERLGYYCVSKASGQKVETYHKVVGLKDTWAKLQ